MKILCTNDDGILAPGFFVLESAIKGRAHVTSIAPDRERSAASHSLNLHTPLRLKDCGPGRFALNGTPVDCVWIGLNHLLRDERPDIILSGVNRGPNLAHDVVYSGTVAAALEGAFQGVPAMALSFVGGPDYPFAEIEAMVTAVVNAFIDAPCPPGNIYNVNFPHPAQWNGDIESTTLGKRYYSQEVVERTDPRGERYLWVGGSRVEREDIPGSDCNALEKGAISVTALGIPWDKEPQDQQLADFISAVKSRL